MKRREIMRPKKPVVVNKQGEDTAAFEDNFKAKETDDLEIVPIKEDKPPVKEKVEIKEEEVKVDTPDEKVIETPEPKKEEIQEVKEEPPKKKTLEDYRAERKQMREQERTCIDCKHIFTDVRTLSKHRSSGTCGRLAKEKNKYECECGAMLLARPGNSAYDVHIKSKRHREYLASQKPKEEPIKHVEPIKKVEPIKPTIPKQSFTHNVTTDFESRVTAEVDKRWKARLDREERERKLVKDAEDRVRKEYEEKLKRATAQPTIRGKARLNPTFQRTASMVQNNRRRYNFT